MLAVDVGKFLQMVLVNPKIAKAFHCLVVPGLGAVAPLAVVPGELVQLIELRLNIAFGTGVHGHIESSFQYENPYGRSIPVGKVRLFPSVFRMLPAGKEAPKGWKYWRRKDFKEGAIPQTETVSFKLRPV